VWSHRERQRHSANETNLKTRTLTHASTQPPAEHQANGRDETSQRQRPTILTHQPFHGTEYPDITDHRRPTSER
jgi:hypothetical protein